MSKQKDSERRRYPRTQSRIPITVAHDEPGILNHVDNISANGVLCHTAQPVPLMTKLGIALELPEEGNRRIECEGIVVRCEADDSAPEQFRVAILYSRISESDRKAIASFVNADLDESASSGSAGAGKRTN